MSCTPRRQQYLENEIGVFEQRPRKPPVANLHSDSVVLSEPPCDGIFCTCLQGSDVCHRPRQLVGANRC